MWFVDLHTYGYYLAMYSYLDISYAIWMLHTQTYIQMLPSGICTMNGVFCC